MKKLFALAAVVAVALTSCVTTTEIPDPAGEIAFEAFNFKAQSRAHYGPIVGSAYPADEHFGAYAFFTESPNTVYMNDVEIQKDTDGAWRNTTQKYYWPNGGTLKFWCYSPYDTAHTVTHDKGFAFPDYTTTADLTKQVDLMATNVVPEARPAAVAAVFHHMLAQVGFTAQANGTAKDANAEITLNKVQLSNVLPTGDYAEGAWTNLDGTPLVYEFVDTPQVLTTTAQPVLPSGNATNALVIPQDGTEGNGDIIATIDYTIKYTDTTVDVVKGVQYKIPAPWVQGKKYIYVITIGIGNEITFNPTVHNWEAEGNGGTITVG
ncbi:MAG: fimbrillin family protein [Tidjanibacter sp.]|nr:fimbrillin family protein [Tidjanibacter sp.]